VAAVLNIRRAVLAGDAGDFYRILFGLGEVEIVGYRIVVELERVGALRQRPAVEVLATRVAQVDREVVVHVRHQDGKVVLGDTKRRRRVGLADAVYVRAARLARNVDMAAGVLAERRGVTRG
jgi:hypothetical protein